MQETNKLAFYWGAVGSAWHSPVKCALKGYQKHPVVKFFSSKVSTAPLLHCTCTLENAELKMPKESLTEREFAFTGWPRLRWVVTDTKYLTKPSKDWQPHIPTANTDTAYIEVRGFQRHCAFYKGRFLTVHEEILCIIKQ